MDQAVSEMQVYAHNTYRKKTTCICLRYCIVREYALWSRHSDYIASRSPGLSRQLSFCLYSSQATWQSHAQAVCIGRMKLANAVVVVDDVVAAALAQNRYACHFDFTMDRTLESVLL